MPYEVHPGVVKGFLNIKNIIENDLPQFKTSWFRNSGQYIDPATLLLANVPAAGVTQQVILQPIYYDADIQIDNVTQGASANKNVPSKKMLGYIQLAPSGEPISKEIFNQLLASNNGGLGGPVDCTVNIAGSGQQMRFNTVQVSSSLDQSGTSPVFAGTGIGAPILPKDGSWSVVQHNHNNDSVTAISSNAAVPLIKIGKLLETGLPDYSGNKLRLANPVDLLKDPDNTTIDIGLLQNTGTQKVLFQLPAYKTGFSQLLSKDQDFPLAKFADAFHLLSSTGIFPNVGDVPGMDMSSYGLNILDYRIPVA